jgi:hypothetical protein
MKNVTLAVITLVLFATACKKDEVGPSMVGYWTGEFNTNKDPNTKKAISFMFKADGTVRSYTSIKTDTSSAVKEDGNYTVVDKKLSLSTVGASIGTTLKLPLYYTADLDDDFTKTSNGKYNTIITPQGLGEFSITKAQ